MLAKDIINTQYQSNTYLDLKDKDPSNDMTNLINHLSDKSLHINLHIQKDGISTE